MKNNPACYLLGLTLVASWLLTGCDTQPNEQRRAGGQKIIQTVDDAANKRLREIRGGSPANQEPKQEEYNDENSEQGAKTVAEAQGNETTRSASPERDGQSPLDKASKKLDDQEIVDAREKTPVEPTEVHEALKPLIQDHWERLNPGYEVWLDVKNKQVIVGGRVSLRDGILEMFACPVDTKEHESIISTVSDAETVHIGLLGIGAVKGMPAYWTEDTGVVTALGPICQINVVWQKDGERKEVNAKEMIINQVTGKTLEHDWVFCGSRVWTDPDDPSYREYQANMGDMICVSNFPTAMMDLTIESSTSDTSRLFVANPDKIPVIPGQPVLIIIKPDPSTNPSEESVSVAEDARDKAQAKMQADMEARMKEREKEYQRQEDEAKAARDKEAKEASDSDKKTGDGGEG